MTSSKISSAVPTAPPEVTAWPVPSAPVQEDVVNTTSTTSYAAVPTGSCTTSHPPPGVPDGGVWGKTRVAEGITWLSCAVMCLLAGPFLLFGLPAFCCPCDEADAYKVNNKIYTAHGRYLGRHGTINFRPMAAWGPTPIITSPPPATVTTSTTKYPDGSEQIVETIYNPDGSKTVKTTTTR